MGELVVFQGDSITHGGRGETKDPNHILGHSYPFLIAAEAGATHPDLGRRFVNQGISGDTLAAMTARWQPDVLDLRPDLLSILIGVNDVGAIMDGLSEDLDGSRFGAQYDELLTRTRAALPGVRLVLGEPFYLPTSPRPDLRATWAAHVHARAAIVRALADSHDAAFVPYQQAMDAAALRAPASYWIWDGVHPTYAGQRILADTWISAVTAGTA
ncbi:SGNH/GDSL hydrolase family protein [Kribbella qitaiheensis]|uniref:SGNH/GDSL hydrolase family protein n=1 Tax=Kribbella qitaiheensis TaxID=1544730 RepID=UPI00360D36E0